MRTPRAFCTAERSSVAAELNPAYLGPVVRRLRGPGRFIGFVHTHPGIAAPTFSDADAMALDQVVRSPRARALGWTPTLHSVAGNAARLLEEWRESRSSNSMV